MAPCCAIPVGRVHGSGWRLGARFELLLDIVRADDGATATLEFDADLLSPEAAERLQPSSWAAS